MGPARANLLDRSYQGRESVGRKFIYVARRKFTSDSRRRRMVPMVKKPSMKLN